jgi:hypothetical protein
MINHLWNCFETTGHIQTYLHYKEYEDTKNQSFSSENTTEIEGVIDGIDEV